MDRKKIGIVTIYNHNYNFGAVLQAYALQRTLIELGVDAVVLDIRFKQVDVVSGKNKITISRICNKMRCEIQKIYFKDEIRRLHDRCTKYQNFKEQWILTTKTIEEEELCSIGDTFDLYIAGSDQIWNPNYWKAAYFLDFVPDGTRKISYSASIGIREYDKAQQEYARRFLKSFSRISVRETDAVKILKSLKLRQEIEVVLDPTFLLGPVEWDRMCKKVKLPDKYVLCCLLGESRECRKFAVRFARERNVKLVMLTTSYKEMLINHKTGDLELIDVDPGEVLWTIRNATIVLTDSFHIMALSVNYGKQFYVLRRDQDTQHYNMNSRIYSFLKEIGLESRLIEGDRLPDQEMIVYEQVEKILEKRKEESLLFLKSVLQLRVQKRAEGGRFEEGWSSNDI